MRVCVECKNYTLEKVHCNNITVSAHPMQFNPNDRYGNYRRSAKQFEKNIVN